MAVLDIKSPASGVKEHNADKSPDVQPYEKEGARKEEKGDRLFGKVLQYAEDSMLSAKLLYFIITLAIYSTHTFTCQFFVKEYGMTLTEFGIVSSLTGINFLGSMFWSHFADKTGLHKQILVVCTVGYAGFFSLLLIKIDIRANYVGALAFTCFAYGAAQFFNSALYPLLDNQVMLMLGSRPGFSKEVFGRIRLWSSLGHCAITIINALIMKKLGEVAMFVTLNVSCLCFVVLVFFTIRNTGRAEPHTVHDGPNTKALAVQSDSKARAEEGAVPEKTAISTTGDADPADDVKHGGGQPPQKTVKPLQALLRNPNYVFFLVVIFLASYPRSILSFYHAMFLNYFYKKIGKEHSDNALMTALSHISRMVSEVLIFFFGKQMMDFFGVYWILAIAQLTGLVRVFSYSMVPAYGDWWTITYGIELLKGVNTACMISAAVKMVSEMAPKHGRATAQGIFAGVYSGFGTAVAGLLGGVLADPATYSLEPTVENQLWSMQEMFLITSIVTAAAFLLYVGKYGFIDRKFTLKFGKRARESEACNNKNNNNNNNNNKLPV